MTDHTPTPPNIAAPADTTQTADWRADIHGNWTRGFLGTARTVSDHQIEIEGTQFSDGHTTRVINAHALWLDADTARQLAAALIEAADELDRLT